MARAAGALVFYSASGLLSTASGTALTLTRAALGQWYLLNSAGVETYNVIADNSPTMRPGNVPFPAQPGQYSDTSGVLLTSNEYQEAFGTAAGGPGNPMSGVPASTTINAALPSPQFQFGTPAVPFGLSLIDVFAVYAVTTAALTTATISASRLIYNENTALSNTQLINASAIATTTTTSLSTPHVQKVSVAQPVVFEAADYSSLIIEAQFVTAATSLIYIYGIGAHYAVVC
jgi:hypothetical protein